MDWWQTFIGTALLGTDRQSPSAPTDETPLAQSISQLDWTNPAQALLSTAGVVALHHQAGQQPPKKPWPPLPPCPIDEQPECSASIARSVQRCRGDYADILPELLMLIAQRQQRVPAALLPDLLDLGARNTVLRPFILSVLGHTGHWLAAHHRPWHYGTGVTLSHAEFHSEAVQALWQDGTKEERLALLEQWREACPEDALQTLEAIWASELAKNREAFLDRLQPQLSMVDEPFLESALDDRAKGVRNGAIALLRQLPTSRLCQRIAQRTHAYIQIHPSSSDTLSIIVTLPETYASDWKRDGIVELQPSRKTSKAQGKRAGWLCQLIASTPLNHWTAADASADVVSSSDVDPHAIALRIQAAIGHPWQAVIIKGWAIATQRQQNQAWAQVLLNHIDLPTLNTLDPQLYPSLKALLSLDQQEALLTQQCPSPASDEFLPWLQQVTHRSLDQGTRSWSLTFSQFVWQKMTSYMTSKQATRSRPYQVFSLIKDLGITLDPAIAPDVAQYVERLPQSSATPWERSLNECYGRLKFRHGIHQAFLQD